VTLEILLKPIISDIKIQQTAKSVIIDDLSCCFYLRIGLTLRRKNLKNSRNPADGQHGKYVLFYRH